MTDWYGPKSLIPGTKAHAASKNNPAHINYVPRHTPAKTKNTGWSTPSNYAPTQTPTYGSSHRSIGSSGNSGLGKFILIVIVGFLALAFFGKQSPPDPSNSDTTSVTRSSATNGQITSSVPLTSTQRPDGAPDKLKETDSSVPSATDTQPTITLSNSTREIPSVLPATGTLRPHIQDQQLAYVMQDLNTISEAGSSFNYFISTEGLFVIEERRSQGKRQAAFDISALDLNRSTYNVEERVLSVPCFSSTPCVQAAVYQDGQPGSDIRGYSGQQFGIRYQENVRRFLRDLQKLQTFVAQ